MAASPRRIGVAGMALALVISARAQPPNASAPPLTVDAAVHQAIAGNPAIRAATLDVMSAESGARSGRSPADPEVVFTPAITSGGSDEELLIRQPLEINGIRSARAGIAAARLRGARAEAVLTLRDLVYQTEAAYYELARVRLLRDLAGEDLKAAEELDRITGRQVEIGGRPGIDRTQTGIEAAQAGRRLIRAESDVTVAEVALNTLMARPPGTPIGSLSPLSATPERPGAEGLLDNALAARADVVMEESERDAFRREADLARAEGRPDIAPQFRAGSLTRGVSEAGFGIGITIPLIDHGSRRNRIRQAEQSARAQEAHIALRRNLATLEITTAVARLEAAEATVKSYAEGTLDDARRLMDASRVGYQAGQTSIIALLDAQRTWRAVQAEHTNALAECALAAAALRHAAAVVPAEWLPTPTERRTGP